MTEKEFLLKLENEYREKGFQFVDYRNLEKPLSFRPDMILEKNGEFTVIEVKSSKSRDSERLIRSIREEVEKKGWRFELKLVPQSSFSDLQPDGNAVEKRMLQAEKFFREEEYDLALVFAWISIEAGLRELLSNSVTDSKILLNPASMLRLAFENELMSEDDLINLRRILDFRNRVIHGMRADGLTPEDVNGTIRYARKFYEMSDS